MSADLHSLLAPYALNALDDEERTRFEAHLNQCTDCQAELRGFMATAVRLGDAASHTPPPELRSRLLAQIGSIPQERPVVTSLAQRRGLRRTLPRLAMAAAVLVGVVGIGGYFAERQDAQDERDRNVAITEVIGAPDVATTAKTFDDGGSVKLYSSESVDRAVILANGLPKPAGGKVYQVWLIDAAGPHSHGTFETGGQMVMDGVSAADRIAVTVEPKGGSAKPTTPPVATIPI